MPKVSRNSSKRSEFVNRLNSFATVQPNQLKSKYRRVVLQYLEKSDAIDSVHWTSHILQGTRITRPCITDHPVFTLGPFIELISYEQ